MRYHFISFPKPQVKYGILIYVFTFFQCNPINDSGWEREIIPGEILTFNIDQQTPPRTKAVFSFQYQQKEYLAYLNDINNSILVFDLETTLLVKKVVYEYEGPNGVGNIGGFHVLGFDSIFITPQVGGRLYLTNDKGIVIRMYDYGDHPSFSGTFQSKSNLATPMIVEGDVIFILQFPPSPYNQISLQQFMSSSLGMKMGIRTGDVVKLEVNYPGEYWQNGYYPPYVARQFDGHIFTYSFPYSTNIYFHTKQGRHLNSQKIIYGFDNFSRYDVESIEESVLRRIRQPWIANWLYDKYRQVYYLIYYPGKQDMDLSGQDLMMLRRNLTRFEIIVLDRKLDVIASYRVPDNTYLIDNMFVARDGLYVSRNNMFNVDINEDRLTFQVMELRAL